MSNKSQSEFMLHTVATFSPGEVNLLASKYGYRWPEDTDEARTEFLYDLWRRKGDKILLDIASIHPDKDLIVEAHKIVNNKQTNSADGTPMPLVTSAPIVAPAGVVTQKGMTEGERLLCFVLFIGIIIALIFKK